MKKKIVTALAVLTILKGVSASIPHIVFAVGEDKRIAEKDQEISELKIQENEIQRSIYVLEGQIADLQAQIDYLQEELENTQEELNRLLGEINDLQERINLRHRRIEENARTLQLNKNGIWLNYLKVIFDQGSNWSQKISALTSISKIMSSQNALIKQQERDYAALQDKEVMANKKVALINENLAKAQRVREELEQGQADLAVQKLDLEIRRSSAEDEKQVLIARREEAQVAAIKAQERQKRDLEEERALQSIKTMATVSDAAVQRTVVSPYRTSFTSAISSGGGYSGGMQCTDYTTAKTGIGGLGNASQWATNAQAEGLRVDHIGEAGAAVAFAPGVGGASSFGHVGVVESVNSDGTVNMSEANYSGGFHKRTIDPRASGVSIIHSH
ncbi:MAG: CHAP domain-containing protein [Lactobacillales bacterium]|jgi:peptidoglycan hydrolase CwlO-like protein|nr:CHAP domain-containing protein [Lactobacillales bacterium]